MTYRPHVGRLTVKKTLSSMSVARIRKTAYMQRQARPTRLSSRNRFMLNATYSIISVDRSEMALYSKPAEFMPTCNHHNVTIKVNLTMIRSE